MYGNGNSRARGTNNLITKTAPVPPTNFRLSRGTSPTTGNSNKNTSPSPKNHGYFQNKAIRMPLHSNSDVNLIQTNND